jgi:hypothetical protein
MMNCKDVSRWLNERETADLPAAELAALRNHVVGCAECAEQAAVAAEIASFRSAVPAVPASLYERAWQLEALRESKLCRRRTRRPVLVGSLLLLGAAATMFTPVGISDASPAER